MGFETTPFIMNITSERMNSIKLLSKMEWNERLHGGDGWWNVTHQSSVRQAATCCSIVPCKPTNHLNIFTTSTEGGWLVGQLLLVAVNLIACLVKQFFGIWDSIIYLLVPFWAIKVYYVIALQIIFWWWLWLFYYVQNWKTIFDRCIWFMGVVSTLGV